MSISEHMEGKGRSALLVRETKLADGTLLMQKFNRRSVLVYERYYTAPRIIDLLETLKAAKD